MANKIVLGSGKLYIATASYTAGVATIPSDATLETTNNLLGYIQGGASISYNPSFYSCKDDLGIVSKKIITDEEAVLKTGIMTWNSQTLDKLISTAVLTSTSSLHTLKIGGVGNFDGTAYVIRFVHEDAVDGDIRVTIVGSNEAGFELSFAKDKETVVNAEFKAQSQDLVGTLILIHEEIPA